MTATLPYRLTTDRPPQLGLIVLKSDETIERDFRRLMPRRAELMVSRIPSAPEVTSETLAAMEHGMTAAAALFPEAADFAAVGYGCTSGAATIGPETVAEKVRAGTRTRAVTDPTSALIAACRALGIARLALVSPYVAPVSAHLRGVLAGAGIETPVFASFDVAEEEKVVRIDTPSVTAAAEAVLARAQAGGEAIDGVFLSCTNLRTLDAIPQIEGRARLPVLSSNLCLAWHMAVLAGLAPGLPRTLLDAATS